MNDIPTLWDVPSQARPMLDVPLSYRRTDPDTSRQAAEDNAPRRTAQQERVLAALAFMGDEGATDAAVASHVGLPGNTIATRRRELETLGLVERTEERRRTPSGSTAIVFRVTDAGRALVEELRSAS